MSVKNNFLFWALWIVATVIGGGALAGFMFIGGPRHLLLIGKTTSAHAQIELTCENCHTTGIVENFTVKKSKLDKTMTKVCLDCHQDEKKVSDDSHPPKKFRGAKAAKLRKQLNAQVCTSCHVEHTPEITNANALTLPPDLCVACHEKVGEERESHAGLGMLTCATAGCHNFHDNTALYENFLVKHAGGDWVKEHAVLPFASAERVTPALFATLETSDPIANLRAYFDEKDVEDDGKAAITALEKVLFAENAIAPEEYMTDDAIHAWAGSAHALNGINCASCHVPEQAESTDLVALKEEWIEKPPIAVCADCHTNQANTFAEGKHGMRHHPKLAKPRKPIDEDSTLAFLNFFFKDEPLPQMTVGESFLADKMKPSAHHLTIGNCGDCHKPHEVDLKVAAVESCASCHNDTHTQNYFNSPHYELWKAELAGTAGAGTGVTCADCHMPKLESNSEAKGFFTTHNQNAYFSPNEKMIRPVCLSCHSLDFAIDALADPDLVEKNFNGRPSKHIESIDWAIKREE